MATVALDHPGNPSAQTIRKAERYSRHTEQLDNITFRVSRFDTTFNGTGSYFVTVNRRMMTAECTCPATVLCSHILAAGIVAGGFQPAEPADTGSFDPFEGLP